MAMQDVVNQILDILPQTQCEECGFKGCRPYAEAIVEGGAIDLCAPGGEVTYQAIKHLVGREGNIANVKARYQAPRLAVIDQSVCIGCTKCIKPCPTNAIVGYKKMNHFVIAADCTGCGLCVEYCPVDCIHMEADQLTQAGALSLADEYRRLYEKKQANLEQPKLEKKSRMDIQNSLKGLLGEDFES